MWAFSDESERANQMLLSIVLCGPEDVGAARADLRRLLLAGQRRIHTSAESGRRRRELLATVASCGGVSAVVLTYRRPMGIDRVAGRRVLLEAAAGIAVERGVTTWTLDDQNRAQRARDRASIANALRGLDPDPRLVYEGYDHRPSHTEPLLWAADAVCWAVGAGGDWRRRVAGITEIRELGG